MTSDRLFLAGVAVGVVGFGGALALIYWDGAIDRWYANRKRKADRGTVSIR